MPAFPDQMEERITRYLQGHGDDVAPAPIVANAILPVVAR